MYNIDLMYNRELTQISLYYTDKSILYCRIQYLYYTYKSILYLQYIDLMYNRELTHEFCILQYSIIEN